MPPRHRLPASTAQARLGSASTSGDLSALTVVVLRSKLKELGLPTSGTKDQLVERLRGADTTQAFQESDRVASTEQAAQDSDSLMSLLEMGFARGSAVAALAIFGSDTVAAAEYLAEQSMDGEPVPKRGRTSSSLRSASFASSSASSSTREVPIAPQRKTRYRRPLAGTDDRIDRALSQRLYLLDRQDGNIADLSPCAVLKVLGSTGNVYEVQISGSPCCDCPDFVRRQSPCKHVLFVMIRVLRLETDDPRIWQKRLKVSDVVEILQHRRSSAVGHSVAAPKDVKKRYDQAMGNTTGQPEPLADSGRMRKPLDDDECPICYEDINDDEERKGLVTFCLCCGSNFHKDCIERWQKASKKGDCPFCREPYRRPPLQVAPGSAMPAASKAAPRALSRCNSWSLGYLNLLQEVDD